MLGELNADKAESDVQAGLIAERIRTTLAEPYLLAVKHEGSTGTTIGHHCTASIGVVFGKLESSQEDVLKWADAAMYQAKDEGRNLVRFHAFST